MIIYMIPVLGPGLGLGLGGIMDSFREGDRRHRLGRDRDGDGEDAVAVASRKVLWTI